MAIISGLLSGLLFGLGLVISGMANPAKVQNFLDLFGAWDPSLAMVMAGAIAVTMLGYRMVTKRDTPLFNTQFHIPTRKDIDFKLLSGASIFGVGWALGGFCPGPAFVGVPLANPGTLTFVAAMLVGMFAAKLLSQPRATIAAAE